MLKYQHRVNWGSQHFYRTGSSLILTLGFVVNFLQLDVDHTFCFHPELNYASFLIFQDGLTPLHLVAARNEAKDIKLGNGATVTHSSCTLWLFGGATSNCQKQNCQLHNSSKNKVRVEKGCWNKNLKGVGGGGTMVIFLKTSASRTYN